jgi:hypothetical protein
MSIPAYASIELIRGSSTFSLTDGTYCVCESMQGIGPMPIRRVLEQGPLQHGATDRGFRADRRLIRLMLRFQVGNTSDYWNRRKQINALLEPTVGLSQLRFDLGNGDRRQVDVSMQGAVMDSVAQDAGVQRVPVDFVCPNPAFYDPNGRAVTFGIDYSSLSFQIPMEIPLGIGQTSDVDVLNTVQYGGSWRSYPYRIRIQGPITDCVITNVATGEKLDFTGVTIAGSDWRDVDLRYSYKTVKDSTNANKIEDLTDDSDLTSWHLATRREVPGGDNTLTVTGTGATTETEVYVSYHEYYNGI